MKKHALTLAAAAALAFGISRIGLLGDFAPTPAAQTQTVQTGQADDALATAFAEHQSGIHVTGEGVVIKVLPDDEEGSRHQRFILKLASGQKVLVAHNIDLAGRLNSLRAGDTVGFSGQYEWNPKGGVIHWTHRDPRGHHRAGWLKLAGQTYQ
ncbi:MAG TPA: DUF3465 domain-containing protein [Limnobacter sp.]|uniref:DUF3465 domain-containing protein n=1 Tax=Limnobacter sp. TaxID=2003368 RepID=UPI002E30531D|nr:DUF3465 domain-containing protein [Limnobacter sp.]HEX5485062.1 DUF3465 domain-containing protein [Limnobacter sp.]